MRPVVIIVSLACAALIGLAVFFSMKGGTDSARIIPLSSDYTQRQQATGWVKGASEPLVIIEEYGDVQCPGCAGFQPIIQGALAQTGDYTQLIFHHYPLPQHPLARLAALGTESAGRQGHFFDLLGSLYSSQDNWTTMTVPQFRAEMLSRAQAIGMNMDQFKADLNSNSVSADVDKDITRGNQLPIEATPTIVINGKKLPTGGYPKTIEEFVSLIEQAKAEVTTVTGTPQAAAQ